MKIAWLSPYNIALLTPELKLERMRDGHPCSWIVNLSRELASREDVDLHIVTVCPFIQHDQVFQKYGITFHVLRHAFPFTVRGFPRYLPLDTLLRYWPLTVRLARTVERIQPQIVHVYGTEYAYGLAALRVSRPVLVSIQGIISLIRNHAPSLFYTLQSPIEKKVVRNTRCFDSRTDWANEYIRSQNPDAKIYKLSRAVNAVFFSEQPAAKGMNLLFVGRVERVKGIEDALQAFAIIHREIPSVRLLVAGRGSDTYVTAMRTYSRILGISNHVEWLGQRTAVELAGLYAQCSLLLHPTHIDNSPNSVAEAMAAGLPVVASNVGGIPSMVDDGVNGKLVKSGDPQALAKVVLTLLRDDGLRCAISAQAREKAEALFRPDRVAEETMKIYRAML